MRSTFINTLVSMAEQDERLFLITPDLGFSVLEEFEDRFPERFLNVGIAEANAIGIAAGLALGGKVVYVYSIIPFITMRPFEQVRVDLAYMNTNVRLVGVGAGFTYGPAGATHHAIEDLAVMNALPNMTVTAPCDPWEVEQLTRASADLQGPMYLRLARNNEPLVSSGEGSLALGGVNIIERHADSDMLILFTGNASDVALQAGKLLAGRGIAADLVSVPYLKPFDEDFVRRMLAAKRYLYTIEEHSLIGGLGSVVATIVAESGHNPVFRRFGLPDEYSHVVGGRDEICSHMNFTADTVVAAILEGMT